MECGGGDPVLLGAWDRAAPGMGLHGPGGRGLPEHSTFNPVPWGAGVRDARRPRMFLRSSWLPGGEEMGSGLEMCGSVTLERSCRRRMGQVWSRESRGSGRCLIYLGLGWVVMQRTSRSGQI